MEVEDVQMQIQSYLCQLGIKDLEEIAKTLGCSGSDVKEKNRKGLVRLIEERLESKLEGTNAEKLEYLEEFKSQMMEHTPMCPPLETVNEKTKPGTSQPPSESGKMETESVKQLYFQPSDFKSVRYRLRPSLQTPGVQDEDLIQQMNVVVSEETERKSKLRTSSHYKSAKVNEVLASQVEEKDSLKEDKFMAALQAVRTELATLKESVEKNRAGEEQFAGVSSGYENQQWYQRPKGCPNCQAAGRGD